MRLTALLTTAGEGSKEALIEAEIEAAREEAKARRRRTCRDPRSRGAAEAEATERVANMTIEVDLDTVDTSALIPRCGRYARSAARLGRTDRQG